MKQDSYCPVFGLRDIRQTKKHLHFRGVSAKAYCLRIRHATCSASFGILKNVAAMCTDALKRGMEPPDKAREFRSSPCQCSAFTIAEVVVAIFLISLGLTGILSLYVQAAFRSDWSAQSLSAQMMAVSGLEQCRAAKFDPRGSSVDQLVSSNFPPRVDILDVGTTASILTYGTNTTTIRTISNDPLIKMIRVDCTWYYPRRGLFTNSVFTYRAPNQ